MEKKLGVYKLEMRKEEEEKKKRSRGSQPEKGRENQKDFTRKGTPSQYIRYGHLYDFT